MAQLSDLRTKDGSRHFASLPAGTDWHAMRAHANSLPGASVTSFVCDDVTEAWIDFTYKGEAFTINDQYGEYWFFVANAACPESVLAEVVAHWEALLGAANA